MSVASDFAVCKCKMYHTAYIQQCTSTRNVYVIWTNTVRIKAIGLVMMIIQSNICFYIKWFGFYPCYSWSTNALVFLLLMVRYR